MIASKSVDAALHLLNTNKSKVLSLSFGTNKVTPGQQIPKSDAQAPPQIFLSLATGAYIVVGLDIDAPFQSLTALSPLLHWLQPGLKPSGAIDGTSRLESSTTPSIANYLGPFPPPGSGPHRYLFLLYEQPVTFDAAKYGLAGGTHVGVWPRTRYDLGAFEKEAQLGPVVAANYFKSN